MMCVIRDICVSWNHDCDVSKPHNRNRSPLILLPTAVKVPGCFFVDYHMCFACPKIDVIYYFGDFVEFKIKVLHTNIRHSMCDA